ncbi:RNA polymerase sigma factor [Herbaspirillum autotrophicum]|uniref:RNA polymerase sigma factor n=1 Tax=Herbaspirillum autotrophicum TaxID=180195 RepID=UPI00067D6D37|nr:sigma-70 family RNA polymerase sigma factor [Herbaspirillum autotrophicum]
MDMTICHFPGAADGVIEYAHVVQEAPAAYDGASLRAFLVANYGRLYRRLLCYLGCPERASDSLHDAWLRLGETTLTAHINSPEAYVYRVACNLATDQLRHHRPWQYSSAAEAELETQADPAAGPEQMAEARSELGALERALQSLPRRHRDVLLSLRLDETSRHEVARQFDISLRSVDTILRQALDHCATQTGQESSGGVSGRRRLLADKAGMRRH